jgi:hypothetical protein
MTPRIGDVLVSSPTATLEYYVRVVPGPQERICPNHSAAVALARELAKERRVDAWLSEDHIHFLRIASHREAGTPRERRGSAAAVESS